MTKRILKSSLMTEKQKRLIRLIDKYTKRKRVHKLMKGITKKGDVKLLIDMFKKEYEEKGIDMMLMIEARERKANRKVYRDLQEEIADSSSMFIKVRPKKGSKTILRKKNKSIDRINPNV